jgi:hypothetical protein
VAATVGGLLGLVGVDADPIRSREHILLSTVFNAAWAGGRDLDLAAVIQAVQKPPFDKVGVLELETFYPAKERLSLAMALNNLIASPGFAAWLQGEPLDVQRLLYNERGQPRIAVISIAHLSDAERMFVVTLLLGEVVAWMRRQSGASSLRALLYMDEIFGYFPPTAAPPAKLPLLTLLKQARAFGLGVVLATQNPVDLDYIGLSNAGTWFIGRLQTERDKARVIDGLLSAVGEGLDKAQIEALLANLSARVFLMRNVHEDAPVLFRSRWALSYLRGPLTLPEISKLMQTTASSAPAGSDQRSATSATVEADDRLQARQGARPVIPAGIPEFHLSTDAPSRTLVPHVLGVARVHFVDKAAGIDAWETRSWIAPMNERDEPDWKQADVAGDLTARLSTQAPAAASYAETPAAFLRPASYKEWARDLAAHIYEWDPFTVLRCPRAGSLVAPTADEGEFRSKLAFALREKRDAHVKRLRKRHAPRVAALENQLRRADERIERERSQLSQQKMQTAISVGASILGALLGRKKISVTNAGRIGAAARKAGRIGRESGDVSRAQDSREVIEQRLEHLQNELEQDLAKASAEFDPAAVVIERVAVKPRKSDITIETLGLLWTAPG